MRKFGFVVTLLLSLACVSKLQATDITLNLNGFQPGYGLNITGPSGYSSGPVYGSPGATYSALGVTTPGTYYVDFYHNGGALGSDYSFNFDGTSITSVSTSAYGSGPYTIVSSFTPDTMYLNTGTVVYNATGVKAGDFFGGGHAYLVSGNAVPRSYQAIPGTAPIDNTRNTGAGNEDFSYQVDGSFNVSAAPGNGGGPTAIPNSEYYTTSGNALTLRSELAHYALTSNLAINIIPDLPITGDTGWLPVPGGFKRDFDMRMPIGGTGFNAEGSNGYTVLSSDMANPNGTLRNGETLPAGDFLFRPTLRYDGLSNGSGYYWLGPGPGIDNEVSASIVGFDSIGNPLTFTVSATLPAYVPPAPEPTTLALLGFGMAAVALRRRKRN